MQKISFLLLQVIAMLLLAAVPGLAQVNVATATLKGTITDPSGAPVAGANVTARSVERGVIRQATTDAKGNYQISLLQPEVYELHVEASGFQSQVTPNIKLTVGQIGIYDLKLRIGEVRERFVVPTDSPLLEPERTQQANTIERRQIEYFPNLSRVFTDYIYTLPGVASTEAARIQNTRLSPFPSSGFSIGGSDGRSNYITVDGGENELGTGGMRMRNLSVESIQEFQVNRNAFAAEYGFTAGTAINVVTKSGTNRYHGSAYTFYRSQKTSARNPFDFASKKAFEQRIYPGFTFGGPIVQNRAFFFTAYEALKQDEARFRSYTRDQSILGLTGPQAAYLSLLTTGPNANDDTRRIAANLRAALVTTNYPETMQILRENEGTFTFPTRSHNWTTRLDYQAGANDNITGRFTLSDVGSSNLSSNNLDSQSRAIRTDEGDYTAVGTWSHNFSEKLYNEARVQFAKARLDQVPPNPESVSVTIAGVINFGRAPSVPLKGSSKRYQFENLLSGIKGRHNWRFGVSYRPAEYNVYNELLFNGVFLFGGGGPLMVAVPAADRAVLTGPLAPPTSTTLTNLQYYNLGLATNWQQGFGNALFEGTQHNLGIFAQTSWKATPRLTVDLGMRVDYDGEPPPLSTNTYVSPRLGFAWDLRGDGRTVIRGGAGTFYAPVLAQIFAAATLQSNKGDHLLIPSRSPADGAQSPTALWRYGLSLGKYPFRGLTEAEIRAFGIIPRPLEPGRRVADASPDYENPYSIQASFSIAQQLGRDFALEVAYQAYRGVHLPIAVENNYRESGTSVAMPGTDQGYLFGPRLERIDPTIAQQLLYSSWGNSIYHGLAVSVTRRFNRHIQFQANYTFSKTIDDVLDFSAAATPFLPTRRYLERALSAFDIRHNFIFSGIFESPFKRGSGQPWYARAFADMTLSPIVFLRSGAPFTTYIGRDVNGDLNVTDRPFYAPRNSGRGPNYQSVNLRLNKSFYFARQTQEGLRMDFIVEANNLFNRTNFLRVNDVVCALTTQPGFIGGCDPKFLTGPFDFVGSKDIPATAPLGFVSAASPRQVQLGLKFTF
jgi:Carboxypeptidase regulatory-like domain